MEGRETDSAGRFALAWLDLDSGSLWASRAIAYFASREDGEAYLAAHRMEYPSGTPNRDSWTEHRVVEVRGGELVIPVPRRPEKRSNLTWFRRRPASRR